MDAQTSIVQNATHPLPVSELATPDPLRLNTQPPPVQGMVLLVQVKSLDRQQLADTINSSTATEIKVSTKQESKQQTSISLIPTAAEVFHLSN